MCSVLCVSAGTVTWGQGVRWELLPRGSEASELVPSLDLQEVQVGKAARGQAKDLPLKIDSWSWGRGLVGA